MNEKTVAEFTDAIIDGKYDSELLVIKSAIRTREEIVGQQTFAKISEGDQVRIKLHPGQKPRYLDGGIGTVSKKNIKNVIVTNIDEAHDPYDKWKNHGLVLDGTNIEKVV